MLSRVQDCRISGPEALKHNTYRDFTRKLGCFQDVQFQKGHQACRTLVNILETRLDFFASVSLSCRGGRLSHGVDHQKKMSHPFNAMIKPTLYIRTGCMLEFVADPQAEDLNPSHQSGILLEMHGVMSRHDENFSQSPVPETAEVRLRCLSIQVGARQRRRAPPGSRKTKLTSAGSITSVVVHCSCIWARTAHGRTTTQSVSSTRSPTAQMDSQETVCPGSELQSMAIR